MKQLLAQYIGVVNSSCVLGELGMYVIIVWGCKWVIGVDVVCVVYVVIDICWDRKYKAIIICGEMRVDIVEVVWH